MLYTRRLLLLLICLGLPALRQSYAAEQHPCLPCHSREVARFQSSAMGQSLQVGGAEPAGSFTQQSSGSKVTAFYKDSVMHQRIEEKGLSAEYPIAYSVGYGKVGKSYLVEVDGHLFQSPAAHYTARSEWDASPGYENQRILDFSRSINSGCVFCHAGSIQTTSLHTTLVPITCDRCHGPAEAHLNRPVPGSIVNPAKLQVRQRDSVCEQCHLEGATLVLNPGKSLWDFQAGQILEGTQTNYVYRTRSGSSLSPHAVSHAEQLALSACRRGSGEKLWCGTCHDPHGDPTNQKVQMEETCRSCHSATQLAKTHVAGQDDCVGCHMPKRQASDIQHAAITDHRILRRPTTNQTAAALTETVDRLLSPWQPSVPEFATRNLGLAFFNVAKGHMSGPDFAKAYELLRSTPEKDDAPVSAAKGYMVLGTGYAATAIGYFKRAVEAEPNNAEYWLDLAVAQNAAGNISDAIRSFQKSILIEPYDLRAYKGLAALYTTLHRPLDSQVILNEFLRRVPQSLTIRLPG